MAEARTVSTENKYLQRYRYYLIRQRILRQACQRLDNLKKESLNNNTRIVRTMLCFRCAGTVPVWNKNGGREIAGHPRAQVDDGHAGRSAQLLHVPHEVELDHQRDHQVNKAGVQEEGGEEAVHLVRGLGPQEGQHAAHVLYAGLAIKNPPKKTQKAHLKKATKNVFFCFLK